MSTLRVTVALSLAILCACKNESLVRSDSLLDNSGANPRAGSEVHGSGYIIRDGEPVKVGFVIRDGHAIFEGDIDLGPVEAIMQAPPEPQPGGPQRGSVINSSSRRWTGGVVAYVIDAAVPDQSRILDALTHIQLNDPGVRFISRTNETDALRFVRTTDDRICGQSAVGRIGGVQEILVHDGCGMGVVAHEVLHALGFWHEQSRCDRDTFVEILTQNIDPNYTDQFGKHCSDGIDVQWYDEGSIMHYGPYAFGRVVNGETLQTIRSRRGLDYQMGQRDGLGWTDALTIDSMYRSPAPTIISLTYPGGVPTMVWHAMPGAVKYVLVLVTKEDGWGSEPWGPVYGVWWSGETTDTTLQDTFDSYTGVSRCSYRTEGLSGWSREYTYELHARFPYLETPVASRAAPVAVC
jgi:hypothetical protein